MKPKRIIIALILVMLTTTLSAQTAYNERVLRTLGLNGDEIRQVLQIQQAASESIRRLEADLTVKKAELARLLLDERPNMRMIERNLGESAEIEVDIRMEEIQREIAVREIIGTDRWARIVQTLRARQQEIAENVTEQAADRFRALQQSIDEKQRAITELIQERRDLLTNDEIREAFRELQEQYLELQNIIREQL